MSTKQAAELILEADFKDLSPEQQVRRIELEYEGGAHDVEIAEMMNLTLAKFDEMYEKSPGFKELVDRGRTKAYAFWMKQPRRNLHNRSFRDTMWAMVMKNRYGWGEKNSSDNGDIPAESLSDDQLEQRLRKVLPKIAKFGGVKGE